MAVGGFVTFACAGCVTVSDKTTVSAGGTSPAANREKKARPPRPSNLHAEVILISAGVPTDSDANGFVDTVPVVVYLFGDVNRYPLPIKEDGEFAFRITTRDGTRIGQWVFSEEQSENASQEMAPGPGYAFGLRLREGVDRMPRVEALVSGRFRDPRTKREIGTNGVAEVLLGAGAGG